MESFSRQNRPTFAILRQRLLDAVNRRVNNGEFSERGLARILGISQPQINNVLKGVRKLNPDTADIMFAKLDMSVLDLLTPNDLLQLTANASRAEPQAAVGPLSLAADYPRRPTGRANHLSAFAKERAS